MPRQQNSTKRWSVRSTAYTYIPLYRCNLHFGLPAARGCRRIPRKSPTIQSDTECRRTSPNFAVNCHSPTELRPPTARKSHPNFFAHCKRSKEMKKYSKTIIPNVQNTMRTQVTPVVSNYGKGLTNRYFSISKHHVNA